MRGRIASLDLIAGALGAFCAAAITGFGIAAPGGPRLLGQRGSPGSIPVDAEVVLAVDVSYSMDPEEQQLQREGYMAAITSREFMQALKQGMNGKIAITY